MAVALLSAPGTSPSPPGSRVLPLSRPELQVPMLPSLRRKQASGREQETSVEVAAETKAIRDSTRLGSWRPGSHSSSSGSELLQDLPRQTSQ